MRFPRTYRDLEESPWCKGYDKPFEYDSCFIYVDPDYIVNWVENDPTIVTGKNLKEALSNLKAEMWPRIKGVRQ